VPERMAEYGIRPRLIYIMRDPFERIESHYNSLRHSRSGRGRIVHEHHVSISDYYLQLSRYRSVFSNVEPLLLDFAELREDPTAVLDSVLRFLGLEMEGDLQVRLHSNPTIPRPLPVRIYDRLVAATGLRAPVPGGVRRAVRGGLVRILGGRRKLSPGEREEVRRRLAPGMRRLRDEFGFDTRRWGF